MVLMNHHPVGTILIATFRRTKWGPAAFWSQPLRYLSTAFTRIESLLLLASLGVVLSGILILLASMIHRR